MEHHNHLSQQARVLEEMVYERTRELARTRLAVVRCLARAAEYRDNDTGRHIVRVGEYAAIIARQMELSPAHIELIELAAPLHDVGKIGIPDSIMLKAGKLDPEEFESMQKHCSLGKRIFECFDGNDRESWRSHVELGAKIIGDADSDLLRVAATIALTHHERWDGTGYPRGLKGEEIPLEGRITAVADVFDALSSRRPYKPAFPRERCFEILEEGRGTQFDPRVLDAFFAAKDEIITTQMKYADGE